MNAYCILFSYININSDIAFNCLTASWAVNVADTVGTLKSLNERNMKKHSLENKRKKRSNVFFRDWRMFSLVLILLADIIFLYIFR